MIKYIEHEIDNLVYVAVIMIAALICILDIPESASNILSALVGACIVKVKGNG